MYNAQSSEGVCSHNVHGKSPKLCVCQVCSLSLLRPGSLAQCGLSQVGGGRPLLAMEMALKV